MGIDGEDVKMMKSAVHLRRTALGLVLAALFWLSAGGIVSAASQTAAKGDIPSVVEETTDSVVAIIGKPSGSRSAWGSDRYNLAHGTGVIVQSDGYILTNAHVVKDMRNLLVVTANGTTYNGKTTHYDEESDLALVKISAVGLPAATFADPAELRVGETVVAIGTPLSFALRNSVTVGIISGMERAVESKYQLIQTDAAINPGNSGGALVNLEGKVVGINTMKYAEYGVDNLGFAIPVGTVEYVLDHFYKYGKVRRPYLGLELGETWEAVVGLPSEGGLEVLYVEPDSPAAAAGIRQGDVLMSIDSQRLRTLVDYNELLKKYLPQEQVRLVVQLNGATSSIVLTMGEDLSASAEIVQDEDGAYIDADQGKTRIGDSHYGWSLKYPSGLIQADRAPDGSSVTLADAKGEFAIQISVQENENQEVTPYLLMKSLNDRISDTVLEKRYFDFDDDTQSYARIVGRTASGSIFEVRCFPKEGRLYYVTLYVQDEGVYDLVHKRNSYAELLDTFTLSFDPGDEALKDISVYQSKNTITTDYGLVFDLPDQWTQDYFSEASLAYSDEEGQRTLALRITSASSGDTLEAWSKRVAAEAEDTFADDYRRIEGWTTLEAAGAPALHNRISTTMGDVWETVDTVLFIKDTYKYEFSLISTEGADDSETKELLEEIVASLEYKKDSAHRGLGFIQDERDLLDKSRRVTYTNKKYKYSLRIPEYWSGDYDYGTDNSYKTFSFTGGYLSIHADDRTGFDEAVKLAEQAYKESAEIDSEYRYTAEDQPFRGTTARVFSLQYVSQSVPYTEREYVFHKNGITYTVNIYIKDAVKTEAQWKRLEESIESLALTE